MAWPEKRYKDRVNRSSDKICMLASYKKKKEERLSYCWIWKFIKN